MSCRLSPKAGSSLFFIEPQHFNMEKDDAQMDYWYTYCIFCFFDSARNPEKHRGLSIHADK
jgi:hypothetical protein